MKTLREENEQRIKTAYGKQLRINRSIQAEGNFAVIKGDMNFRRYLYNGIDNVAALKCIAGYGIQYKQATS